MKKWCKILLIVLGILVLLAGAVAIWQWDNIKVLTIGMTKSEEDLQILVTQTREELADKLELDLSFIELEAKRMEEEPEEAPTTAIKEKTPEQILTELYALEGKFLGKIAAVEGETVAAFKALPAKERKEKQWDLLSEAIGEIFAMEDECDGKVNELIAELREALKREKKDPALADEVFAAYKAEKDLKKAEYLQKYKKYL